MYPNLVSFAQWTLNASVLLEWVCETAGVGLNFQCQVFLPKAHRQCPVTLSPLTLNYLYACYCLHVPLHTEAVERNTFSGGVGKLIPSVCPPPVPLQDFHLSISPPRFVSFSLFFWLSLSRSFVLYFATFLTSLTKAGTVPCLNGAHLLVLTDASRTPLSKQKPLNAASVSMAVTHCVKVFSFSVWAKRGANVA